MIHVNQVVQPFLSLKECDIEFPSLFDASERARLKSMRINRSKREKNLCVQNNFWQLIHGNDSPVQRQRKSMQQGIQHWFYSAVDESSARTRYAASTVKSVDELKTFWSEGDKHALIEYTKAPPAISTAITRRHQ